MNPRVAVLLKGYPRLSETFIAQEILALEKRGFQIDIWSLRKPTDRFSHAMHGQISARLFYLPEYLHDDPLRVLRGLLHSFHHRGALRLFATFARDLIRDPTPNRVRRLGQAMVLAREVDPRIEHLHIHFLHTPGSVGRYAGLLTGKSFSFSAHAKDIWTTPDWERREKLADASWCATCTTDGQSELKRVAAPDDRERVNLVYHGLDLARFPEPPASRPLHDGSDPSNPVKLLAVGRAVEKKGFDDLLEALGRLPPGLNWQLAHIGSGELIGRLKEQAESLGLSEKIDWRGSKAQDSVVAAMREADLFVLPSKQAAGGDRDGLPNVLMEAATQKLPAIATDFAGVPEFVTNGETGLLVEPGDPQALANAIKELIGAPALRHVMGEAAYDRIHAHFSFEAGIGRIEGLLRESLS